MAEQYDLSDADQERAEELSEVFAEVAWDMYEEDKEDIDDIVYAMVMVVSMIVGYKQATNAVKH